MSMIKRYLSSLTLTALASVTLMAQSAADFVPYKETSLRLPSVPLLMNDPYFSIWSNYDALNGGPTKHWCEQEKAIEGLLRVDGTAYRFMGNGLYEGNSGSQGTIQDARQLSVDVLATSTYYKFSCGPVNLELVFTAPMLIDDMDMISTPINFISYQVTSRDGQKHDVQFYLGTSAQLTVNEMTQPTITTTLTENGVKYVKAGSEAQDILGRSGDQITIDWGYLYIPAINGEVGIASNITAESEFEDNGKLPQSAGTSVRSSNLSTMPIICFVNDLGKISEGRDFMMIGYDEVYDIQYMGQNYKAYYARNGKTIIDAFNDFNRDYAPIMERCRALDKMIYDDALAAGNVKYAELLSGTYRHVMGAHKLFEDNTGKIRYFSKGNKSNGCVNTVDLTYPESPLYLLYNPELQKGMILSILDYALTPERKDKNCAAHDLGTYPLANGQVYGDSMPLEESANIIILADAICRITSDIEWLLPYKNVLKTWAEYCRTEGQNPRNQLCADDFKGSSEQNTNLSVKAITAVASYANLLTLFGEDENEVEKYKEYAGNMGLLWEADARDGDHYRMEYHKPGSWSQKYNLVWEKMWDLNIFPYEVIDREVKFYLNHQVKYGLPLDSRDMQTKSDWIIWTASLAADTETFLQFAERQYNYVNETPTRIPLSDYYTANDGKSVNFSARPVMGGLWMKILMDKYHSKEVSSGWSPKGNHIKTRWAKEVDPACPLPEYPRPIMQRSEWQNLNGLWEYAITDAEMTPVRYEGKILVPYAIESSLSGVMRPLEPGKALWYRREIEIPQAWAGKKNTRTFRSSRL